MVANMEKRILNNRYEILHIIGQGGFGSVYKAWDKESKKTVAIKEITDKSSNYLQQLQREADVLKRVQHPSLPKYERIFSAGDAFYLVMEFIEGESLYYILQSQGLVSLEQSLEWIYQIAGAIICLHSVQPPILHRDVKPSNVILKPLGGIVLVDFGSMKYDYSGQDTATIARSVTSGYSPPEQYSRGATTIRSDEYALAATLYALLTAVPPQDSIQRAMEDHLFEAISSSKAIPFEIGKVMLTALSLNPMQRYASVQEFVSALKQSAGRIGLNRLSTKPPLIPIPTSHHLDAAAKGEFPLTVEERGIGGRIANLLFWEYQVNREISYWVVRKYYSKPNHPDDGETWIVKDSKFLDETVEAGLPAYYGIYLYDGARITKTIAIHGPVLILAEVNELQAERHGQSIILSWVSPQYAQKFKVVKNIFHPPTHKYDGTEYEVACDSAHQKNGLRCKWEDSKVPDKKPVHYAVFCEYQKSRDTWITSNGASISI